MFTKHTITRAITIIALLFINLAPIHATTNYQTFPDLQLGDISPYVKEMQKVLNTNGFTIGISGQPGSLNFETTKFGTLTQKALALFQSKYNLTPARGYFGSKTKKKFDEVTKIKVGTNKSVSKGNPVSYGTQTCTSVTQWEITWTFATSTSNPNLPTCGQFANGDWWVVGPVVIADIDPKGDYSGSMINPIPGNQNTQGFFAGVHPSINNYSAAKNISLQLPYTISGNKSLYSTKGSPELWTGPAPEGKYFKETAILTVLDSVPTFGSFRPPYAGTNKTIKSNWNVASLDYSKLRSLPIPNPANVELNQRVSYLTWATQRPLLEMSYEADNSAWKAQWSEPKVGWYPRRAYGADDVARVSSNAGIQLNSNASNAEKEPLLINMVQWGIDNHGLLDAGMQWYPLGGHNVGRLLPTFIAGKVLNDVEILNQIGGNPAIQELANHQFINWTDVNTPRATRVPPPLKPFTADMVGTPEWSSGYHNNPGNSAEWDSSSNPNLPYWGIPYRGSSGLANIGQVATILLMNGREDIDQEAYIRYHIERWIPLGGQVPQLTRDMWNAYIATDSALIPGTMYTLTATTTGAGVIMNYSNKYSRNTTAKLSAEPLTGYSFIGWAGDCSGGSECNLRMDGNKSVTAVFSQPTAGALTSPVISIPTSDNAQYPSNTTNVVVSWNNVSTADRYYVRVKEYTDSSMTTETTRRWAGSTASSPFSRDAYIVKNDHTSRSFSVPVFPGNFYKFWVHSYNGLAPDTYSDPTYINFSIAASGQTVNIIDLDQDSVLDTQDKCLNTPALVRNLVNIYGCPLPLLSGLKMINNISTTDSTNITNLEIEDINSVYGKVKYTQPVNIFGATDKTTRVDLGAYVTIANKKVYIDSTTAPQFNKPATITLYNIDLTKPMVTKNGVTYATSTSPHMTYDPVAKTLTFTVDGF